MGAEQSQETIIRQERDILQIALIICLLWGAIYVLGSVLFLQDRGRLIFLGEIIQLMAGAFFAILLIQIYRKWKGTNALLGTSLALFSWTAGQLFWFSYTLLSHTELPYPSVGDLGYTGTYILLIGVIGLLSGKKPRTAPDYLPLLLVFLPLALYLLGQRALPVLLYNIVDGITIAWTLFSLMPLRRSPRFRRFIQGVILLAATDVLFLFSALLIPEMAALISAPLYPLAIALIAMGIVSGEQVEHG